MANVPGKTELENLTRLLIMAREEDLGGGDVTSAMLPDGRDAKGRFAARQEIVVCGAALLATIAEAYDPAIRTTVIAEEGHCVQSGAAIAEWSGPAKSVLAAERVALNFLQKLCGIATSTHQYVQAAGGVNVYDTRKTMPGWRALSKYAVRCGGGMNHRMGLYDAILVKDNHIALLGDEEASAGGISALADALDGAKRALPLGGFVEVEVDDLKQLETALTLPVDIVLLDNMSCDDMARAVSMRDAAGMKGKVALEASGGVTLASVRQVAQSGVDRIAVGALTHSAPAVDIGLDIVID